VKAERERGEGRSQQKTEEKRVEKKKNKKKKKKKRCSSGALSLPKERRGRGGATEAKTEAVPSFPERSGIYSNKPI